MANLSIIISFLNEKDEIYNTIESIRNNSNEAIPIIVINDASDDDYMYDDIGQIPDVIYIKNKERLGVARSRDLAINLCETAYFLLLDAHMQFYDMRWSNKIIEKLKENDRVLLCCQIKCLQKKDNSIIEVHLPKTFGASIDPSLDTLWRFTEKCANDDVEDVPCVLGAGYAGSKRYWQYLRGLEGLRSYGIDEQYISLKVWLEGGTCKILKNVVIGHIFRTEAPYRIVSRDYLYNRLFITILLMPESMKEHIYKKMEEANPYAFKEACKLLKENVELVYELKLHYKKIFTRTIDEVLEIYRTLN